MSWSAGRCVEDGVRGRQNGTDGLNRLNIGAARAKWGLDGLDWLDRVNIGTAGCVGESSQGKERWPRILFQKHL